MRAQFTGIHTYVVDGDLLSSARRAHDPASRDRVYAALDQFHAWVAAEHPDAEEIIWIDPRSALYTTPDGARAVMELLDDYECRPS